VLPILEPGTHDLRDIDTFHAGLFAVGHKVDPLDARVRKKTLTGPHASGRRCRTDCVTGKSMGFEVFRRTRHIKSRFDKLMHVSSKPVIVHGIASPQTQKATRNEHVSMHRFDLIMDIRRESLLLAGCGLY
jgi:hypothetical protein